MQRSPAFRQNLVLMLAMDAARLPGIHLRVPTIHGYDQQGWDHSSTHGLPSLGWAWDCVGLALWPLLKSLYDPCPLG